MLDHARDCLAARNLSGLLATAQNLPPIGILDLLDSALRSKKEWAWPPLLKFIDPQFHTSVLCLASVHRHQQCFDTIFNNMNWSAVSANIAHDLITRCATHNDTYGFFKIAPFVPLHTCSNIAFIAVARNNPEILAHILSHAVLNAEQQRQSVVKAVECQHETCLDILLPHSTKVAFVDTDIQRMMHHIDAPADLLKKVGPYFTQNNFNTVLHLACLEGNDDVLQFAFPHAQISKVLQLLKGQPSQLLQECINQAQKDRISKKITSKPSAVSVRKM